MVALPNRVSKQQLHLMRLIIVTTLRKFHTLEHLGLLPPEASGICFLNVSASLIENELNKEGVV